MSSSSEALAQETARALLVLIPALGRLAEDATRAEGTISTVQASYIHVLLGGSLQGVEIADRLRTTRASVTEVVQRLKAAGLVRTVPDPSDGRANLVEVTPKGTAAIQRFGKVTSAAVAEVVGQLSPKSLRALRDAARELAPLLANTKSETRS